MWLVNLKYSYKAILTTSIALLLFSEFYTQTFSKRANFDIVSVYREVVNQPYGYQVMGGAYDTTDAPLHLITFVRNFDFDGNELETKIYSFSNGRFLHPGHDVNARLNDTTTVYIVIDTESNNDTMFNTVMWLHNNGDTIKTKRFHSPFHGEGTEHFLPKAMTTSPDGQFIYFTSGVLSQPFQNNFIIKKITADGEEVWTYINPIDDNYYSCSAIKWYQGSLWFVIAGWGLEAYNKLVEIDNSTHTIISEVELIPNGALIGYAEELIMDDNGFVIPCQAFNAENETLPAIYKMDYSGNLSWLAFANGDYRQLQKNDHLVQSQDGGYVSCAVKHESIALSGSGYYNQKIWLWKVGADGELLWQRFYEYLSFDSGYYNLDNTAKDMKATPDGGFIMAGESTSYCANWPLCNEVSQQGWILKVDACGCLVPGCDEDCEVVGVGEFISAEPRQRFKVGPNPVRDMLNVYLSPASPLTPLRWRGELNLTVHDMQGNFIKTFLLKNDDTTYMIDASSLTAGQYVLSLVSDGKVLQTERIVVVK